MIFIAILFSIPYSASAQSKIEKIDALMKLYSEYGQFNGTALVADHGKIIYEKGFGLADMEWNIANQPDTKFRLGSVTKQFTSMLILQLVEQGKIKLNGNITEYLPDYPKKTGNKITIHHLLTHTSGIPGYTEFPNFSRDVIRNPSNLQSIIKLFADSALLFEPGTRFSYSNSGYFLLGAIIEKVTGKPYEQLLQENIFGPLGMNNSGYDHQTSVITNRARGYEKRFSTYVNAGYLDMSVPFSAGALYSTVHDLYLWDQALYTEQLLHKETRGLLFKKYIPAFEGGYGYGWIIGTTPVGNSSERVQIVRHDGFINGFSASILRIPSDKHLIVILNNTGSAPLGEITRAIIGILYAKPYELPKGSIPDSVIFTMMQHGIAAGLTRYKELKEKYSATYALDEREMNAGGYMLLQSGKVKEAIEIFKLNVQDFPESANVYDSLGEAYMANGDTEFAIINYRKSIELNPNNTNGLEQLRKLQSR